MPDLSFHQHPERHQTRGFDGSVVHMTVADYGEDDGIDISVYDPVTDRLCFELVVLNPDDCLLLGKTTQSAAAFNALRRALCGAAGKRSILLFIELRNCQTGRLVCAQRSSRILRMVEDVADEIQTYEPGSKVDISMLASNGEILSLM